MACGSNVTATRNQVQNLTADGLMDDLLGALHCPNQGNTNESFMNLMNKYLTPIIVSVGLIGNLLSFLVFATTHLKKQSSSVYLATLALADTGFLISLLIVWLDTVGVSIFPTEGWCQTVVYLSHVFSFLSVYNVLCFTAERYVIIYCPLRKDQFCSTHKARIAVLILTVVALSGYSYLTWTTGIFQIPTTDRDGVIRLTPTCMPFPRFYDLMTVTNSFNTVVTLFVPSVTIIVLNIKIIIKIYKVQKVRTAYWQTSQLTSKVSAAGYIHTSVSAEGSLHYRFGSQQNNEISDAPSRRDHNRPHHSTPRGPNTQRSRSLLPPPPTRAAVYSQASTGGNQCCTHTSLSHRVERVGGSVSVGLKARGQFRFAKMLLVVSSIFVLLHIPPHYLKIQTFIQHVFSGEFKTDRSQLHWNKLLQLVYHLSFAINFFLYSAMGTSFRRGIRRLIGRYVYCVRRTIQKRRSRANYDHPMAAADDANVISLKHIRS